MIAIFPELLTYARNEQIEHLAIGVRKYYGKPGTYAPCLDLESVLRQVGIRVEFFPIEGLGALAAQDSEGKFNIVAIVKKHLDETNERFLLAHMLGHYLLHIQPIIARGEWDRSGYREAQCPLVRYSQGGMMPSEVGQALEAKREDAADQFAGALLMPMGMLRRTLEKLTDLDKIADFFGVTKNCLIRRQIDLGIIVKQPVNFLDAESTLKTKVSFGPESSNFGHVHQSNQDLRNIDTISTPTQDTHVPRGLAAANYAVASSTPHAPAPKVSPPMSGMERIRAIAMSLERKPRP